MILTPIDRDGQAAGLAGLAGGLTARPVAAAALARIAASRGRGGPEDTAERRDEAVALARALGIPTLDEEPADAFSWDGARLRTRSEAWVVLHEIAHWQLAPPARRPLPDFGLGAGPETGRKEAADAARCLDGTALAEEEAEASLLGILWEAALDRPAIHAFVEQNWLEGWDRPSAAAWFAETVERLHRAGLIDDRAVPSAFPGGRRPVPESDQPALMPCRERMPRISAAVSG
ncbi:MAG: hypothetical protein AB7P02_09240 [Alphaproteobacteria bacterium]